MLPTDTETPEQLLERLFNQRLQREVASKFDSRELRLSESGGCPRLRAAKLSGAVDDERDTWDARYFLAGRLIEREVRSWFSQEFPRRCRQEVEVTHPLGKGHIDLWFPAMRWIVEIKATLAPDAAGLPRQTHVKQATSYLHFFRDADGRRRADYATIAYLILGRPIQLRPFPVVYRPELGEAIEREMAEIARYAADGTLPEAPEEYSPFAPPCRWKMAGKSRLCPLWDQCWREEVTGGQADKDTVLLEGDLAALATEYVANWHEKHEAERQAEEIAATLNEHKEAITSALLALGAKKGKVGDVTLTRIEQKGRTTYHVPDAILCGAIEETTMAPFTNIGEASVQLRVNLPKVKE